MARKLSGACEEQCGVQHLAVLAFWYLLLGVAQRKRDLLAVKVTVRFKLPSCVGLGSSGAYCVCTAAALLLSAGLIPHPTSEVSRCDSIFLFDHRKNLNCKEYKGFWLSMETRLIFGEPPIYGNKKRMQILVLVDWGSKLFCGIGSQRIRKVPLKYERRKEMIDWFYRRVWMME